MYLLRTVILPTLTRPWRGITAIDGIYRIEHQIDKDPDSPYQGFDTHCPSWCYHVAVFTLDCCIFMRHQKLKIVRILALLLQKDMPVYTLYRYFIVGVACMFNLNAWFDQAVWKNIDQGLLVGWIRRQCFLPRRISADIERPCRFIFLLRLSSLLVLEPVYPSNATKAWTKLSRPPLFDNHM